MRGFFKNDTSFFFFFFSFLCVCARARVYVSAWKCSVAFTNGFELWSAVLYRIRNEAQQLFHPPLPIISICVLIIYYILLISISEWVLKKLHSNLRNLEGYICICQYIYIQTHKAKALKSFFSYFWLWLSKVNKLLHIPCYIYLWKWPLLYANWSH